MPVTWVGSAHKFPQYSPARSGTENSSWWKVISMQPLGASMALQLAKPPSLGNRLNEPRRERHALPCEAKPWNVDQVFDLLDVLA
jgi:hypothetical protein